jgi:hypothetical protein
LHQKGCTAPRAVWCAQLSGLRVIRRDCPRHVSRLARRFQGQTRVTRASIGLLGLRDLATCNY